MKEKKDHGHLSETAINLPQCLLSFLYTSITGNTEIPDEFPERIQRLINSFGQDLIYGVSAGHQKPPKQILLSQAVKTLTNNVELIRILNRFEHGIAYSQLEEMNTLTEQITRPLFGEEVCNPVLLFPLLLEMVGCKKMA